MIRVYDDAGNVIETHEHAGEFKECWRSAALPMVQKRLRCRLAQFNLCAQSHSFQMLRPFTDLPTITGGRSNLSVCRARLSTLQSLEAASRLFVFLSLSSQITCSF